jgi:organic hydroperoxide reductase OsmC/OhrA
LSESIGARARAVKDVAEGRRRRIPAISREKADGVLHAADAIGPYSGATRRKIEVTLELM